MNVKSATQLGNFWLISSVDSLYKLVAKMLVARLSEVMNKLVFHNQTPLFKGGLFDKER